MVTTKKAAPQAIINISDSFLLNSELDKLSPKAVIAISQSVLDLLTQALLTAEEVEHTY